MKITFTKNHFKVLYLVVSRKKRKKTLNFNAELQTAISCLPCKRKKPNTMDLRRTRGPFFFVMKITTRKIGLSKILHEFFFSFFFFREMIPSNRLFAENSSCLLTQHRTLRHFWKEKNEGNFSVLTTFARFHYFRNKPIFIFEQFSYKSDN